MMHLTKHYNKTRRAGASALNPVFSRRELRVIGWLAKGATTQDLVAKLGVKKPVVLNYIHFAYKKAGVRTRPELVEWRRIAGHASPVG